MNNDLINCETLKDEVTLKKSNLFGRKCIVLRESKEFHVEKNEIDFKPIVIRTRKFCKPDGNGGLKLYEESDIFWSPETFLNMAAVIEQNLGQIRKRKEILEATIKGLPDGELQDENKKMLEDIEKSEKDCKNILKQHEKLKSYGHKLALAEAKADEKTKVKYIG
jgi:hypothetical protein